MYQKVNVPILGFVENMSGEIFGRGGAHKVAQELKVPFLGEIPMNGCIREYCDRGQIMSMLTDDNPSRDALHCLSECRDAGIQGIDQVTFRTSPRNPVKL